MEYTPLHFVGDQIEVEFEKDPLFSKKPTCPNRITWKGNTYRVEEVLAEWQDFGRRGDMSHNMRPANLAKALRRGSWGVGRYYFRIKIDADRVFDIYYDRAPKNAADRVGAWFLYREMKKSRESGPENDIR